MNPLRSAVNALFWPASKALQKRFTSRKRPLQSRFSEAAVKRPRSGHGECEMSRNNLLWPMILLLLLLAGAVYIGHLWTMQQVELADRPVSVAETIAARQQQGRDGSSLGWLVAALLCIGGLGITAVLFYFGGQLARQVRLTRRQQQSPRPVIRDVPVVRSLPEERPQLTDGWMNHE